MKKFWPLFAMANVHGIQPTHLRTNSPCNTNQSIWQLAFSVTTIPGAMATRLLALATVFLGAQATKKSLRPEEEAFLELDKDHSGKVEYAELEAFGKSKGMKDDQIYEEFRNMDLNHNGIIEADELRQSLLAAAPGGETAQTAQTAQTAAGLASEGLQALQQAEALPALPPQAQELHQSPKASEFEALDGSVRHSAGRVLAELFERKAAEALVSMHKDTREAQRLESTASQLRGKAERLQRGIHGAVATAAKTVADEILKKTVREVNLMSEEVKLAEENAAQSQELANEAMQKAKAAERALSSEVHRIRQANE